MGAETSAEAQEPAAEPNAPTAEAGPDPETVADFLGETQREEQANETRPEPEPTEAAPTAEEVRSVTFQLGSPPRPEPAQTAQTAQPEEEVQSAGYPSRSPEDQTQTPLRPPLPPRRRTVHNPGELVGIQSIHRVQNRRPRTWYGEREEFTGTRDFKDDDELANPAVNVPAEPDPDFSQEGPLSLKTRVEYSAMPKNAMQAVFGLVTVEAAAVPSVEASEADRKPMDLVCVLDTSGSMGSQNKIEDLKSAVRFIISESLPSDRLSLVTFQSSASRDLRLRRMDREGQDEATVATLRMAAGGGTLIASGLELGLQVLEQRRQRNKVCAILLLTDGQDHSCRMHLPQLLQRASKMGCSIYPFGFGKDHDSALLRELSERAKTPFTYVEETSTIKEAFAGVVGGLSSIVAQKVQVTLNCQAKLKEVNTPFEVQRPDEKTAVITIPDIFAEERRDLLVELEVPQEMNQSETVLLEASAQYVAVREAAEVRVQTPVVSMTVQRVDEPQPEQEPDEEVFEQRQRWEVTSVLEQASKRSDQGNFEEARQLLSGKRKTLRESRKSRTTQALQTELEDAEARMRNFGTWTEGSASVRDATTMHLMQRTTNTISSCFRGEAKTSKSLYVSTAQSERIRRSTVVGAPFAGPPSASAASSAAMVERWRAEEDAKRRERVTVPAQSSAAASGTAQDSWDSSPSDRA